MLTQAPRGTYDILPEESYRWQAMEAVCRDIAHRAGYREVRTPIIEHTELFLRGVGDTTDIVQKEMYTFEDKGNRSITLRPEGTAGAVRALVEHSLYAGLLPARMYYLAAPIFRYDTPQHGRYREHRQFGVEIFGAKEPTADAEIIVTAMRVLSAMGLTGLTASINSIGCPKCRGGYQAALKAFVGERISTLCNTCRDRFDKNPLRILDCKVEACQEQLVGAPATVDHLCDDCSTHLEGLKQSLEALDVPYAVDPRIVRGLDYYTNTVFEVLKQVGQGTIALCAGGRYDGLVEQLGGPALPGAGFGMGMERVLLALEQEGIQIKTPTLFDIFVASLGAEARIPALKLANALRDESIPTEMDHIGKSLKAQFKAADRLGVRYVIIVGGDELARGTVRIRDMQTKEELEIPLDQAVSSMKERLSHA